MADAYSAIIINKAKEVGDAAITFEPLATTVGKNERSIIFFRRGEDLLPYNIEDAYKFYIVDNNNDFFTKQPITPIERERIVLYYTAYTKFPHFVSSVGSRQLLIHEWINNLSSPVSDPLLKLKATAFIHGEDLVTFTSGMYNGKDISRDDAENIIGKLPVGSWLCRKSSIVDSKILKAFVITHKPTEGKIDHRLIIHVIGYGIVIVEGLASGFKLPESYKTFFTIPTLKIIATYPSVLSHIHNELFQKRLNMNQWIDYENAYLLTTRKKNIGKLIGFDLVVFDFDGTIVKEAMSNEFSPRIVNGNLNNLFVDLELFKSIVHSVVNAGKKVAIASFGRYGPIRYLMNRVFGANQTIFTSENISTGRLFKIQEGNKIVPIVNPLEENLELETFDLGGKNLQLGELMKKYNVVDKKKVIMFDDNAKNVEKLALGGFAHAISTPKGLTASSLDGEMSMIQSGGEWAFYKKKYLETHDAVYKSIYKRFKSPLNSNLQL